MSAANRAEAKACIKEYWYLDQNCPKGRRPLKLSIDSQDERLGEKPKPKTTTSGLTVTPTKPSGSHRIETEVGEKARKEKKRKLHQE